MRYASRPSYGAVGKSPANAELSRLPRARFCIQGEYPTCPVSLEWTAKSTEIDVGFVDGNLADSYIPARMGKRRSRGFARNCPGRLRPRELFKKIDYPEQWQLIQYKNGSHLEASCTTLANLNRGDHTRLTSGVCLDYSGK